MIRILFLLFVLCSINIETARAQCLGSCGIAECCTTSTGEQSSKNKGTWQLDLGYSNLKYNPFTNDELLAHSTIDNSTFSVSSQQIIQLAIRYNLTNRIQLSAILPYNLSFDNREGHTHSNNIAGIHDYGNVYGIGDATCLSSYEWLLNNKTGWSFSTGIGIKIPTGQTNAVSTYNAVVPLHLQPGTGSWDPIIILESSKNLNRFTIEGDAFAKIATTAKDHYMGNYLNSSATLFLQCIKKPNHPFSSLQLLASLQFDYNSKMKMPVDHVHIGETTIQIQDFENSGGWHLFFSTGFMASFGKHVTIPFTFAVPICQNLNGYQVKMESKGSVGIIVNY
jgi:hypothetical protein